ncbi:hypothetical protein ACS0PU_009328 [Formica fusca]
MRLTVVYLIMAILICAMIQESEQLFWRRGHRRCCSRTTTTTTTMPSLITVTLSGKIKREIMAAPLLSALTNKREEIGKSSLHEGK